MIDKSSAQKFRAGVGAVIVNDEGLVLALERKDIPGAWQLPQGGLDKGEEPIQAVKREILEETGIEQNSLKLITNEFRLLTYELPKEYRSEKTGRGQTQYWYLFKYLRDDKGIRIKHTKEFRDWKWMPMEKLASIAVDFRKPVYKELVAFIKQNNEKLND